MERMDRLKGCQPDPFSSYPAKVFLKICADSQIGMHDASGYVSMSCRSCKWICTVRM